MTLPMQQVAGQSSLIQFDIDISESVSRSKDSFVYLQVIELHKRRREPYPVMASITEKQSFRFRDSAVMLSPYVVEKQKLEVSLPQGAKVVKAPTGRDVSSEDNKYTFESVSNVKPLTFDLFSFMFEHKDPYVILTEATRKISVSHWGNIAVDEHFLLKNIGPAVKGQFSRYDVDMAGAGKSCLSVLSSEYPYYAKGMYLHDYIGNISSSNAQRLPLSV